MALLPRQFIASIILSISLLVLIIRLVQKGRLDIAYCWLWLFIGAGIMLIVIRYDWLTRVSSLIGAVANTTTLFLLGFFVLLMLCLQFSLVISHHRRQIKRLTQELAVLRKESPQENTPSTKPAK
ncbi:MAG: DUF2304 domain-containing protein [Kiritimatiellae bacterium]|nr:DUF2304 domain-containing protein [Kiritimatiellia bacterium]